MPRVLKCRDVGFDCDAEVRAADDDAVMAEVARHARDVHGLDEVPADVAQRARERIRSEPT